MPADELHQQYQTFQQRGAAFDVSSRTRLRVEGRDRLRFVNNLCTAKLVDLPAGQGAEAFFLDVKGHVLAHGVVYICTDSLWIESAPAAAPDLIAHFNRYLISEKVSFHDATSETTATLVCGLRIAATLDAQLSGNTFPDESRLAVLESHADGQTQLFAKSDLLGPPGVLWIRPRSDHQPTSDVGDPGLLESLRIEHGCPLFGCDIDRRNLPQEVGRDDLAISFNKGCYLGQETVARLDALGHVNRRLVRLQFAGDSIPPVGFKIERDGKIIGRVTSAARSASSGKPIALAYLRSGFESPGTRLETELGPAEVLPLRPTTAS